MNYLKEAEKIIHGDREQVYGTPGKNINNIAQQWRLFILQKFSVDVPLGAEDVCWMMSDLKKVRQMNVAKDDNVIDAAGYLGLIGRLEE